MVSIYALVRTHKRSTVSFRGFLYVAFETGPLFVRLTMAFSRPVKEDRRMPPLSTRRSSGRPMMWCPWFYAPRKCFTLRNTPGTPGDRWSDVLGFMPPCSVSRSSVLPVFRATDGVILLVYAPRKCPTLSSILPLLLDTSHSGQLLCLPISLLGQVIVLDSGMSRTRQSALRILVFSFCSVVVVFCL